jgi:hypothetical protein
LKEIWRSAGWPVRDGVEMDLLTANWVTLSVATSGHETLCVTDAGLRLLADARERGRRACSPHDRLGQRVATHLMDSGRIVWRELSLRAKYDVAEPSSSGSEPPADAPLALLVIGDEIASVPAANRKTSWRIARPDVFSVRNTSVEDYLHPAVHEIKVNRADLLSDLRNPAKRESYRWLCCECFYVFPHGIAEPQEIPEEFGVWTLHGAIDDGRLELLRPARHSPCKLPFPVWLALAKATPMRPDRESAQDCLADQQAIEQYADA